MAAKGSKTKTAPVKKAAVSRPKPEAKKPAAKAKAPALGPVPAVNPAMTGDVASAHSVQARRMMAKPAKLPEGVVELNEKKVSVPDPIKGFILDTEEGKRGLKEDQQPYYVTKAALDDANKEVVSRGTLDKVYKDLESYRTNIDSEMPDLVPAFNKLITGVLEFIGAADARRERLLQDGNRAALSLIREARAAEMDVEDEEKKNK